MKKLVIAGGCLIAPGCASVIDGTSQQIALNSNPPGAQCLLNRNGEIIGNVTTPGAVLIKKTKHDIDVSCSKEGYQTSTARLKSEIQDATWGNIILGGGIGWAIDSASGADNKYQDHLTVTLNPDVDALKASMATAQAPATTPVATTPGDNAAVAASEAAATEPTVASSEIADTATMEAAATETVATEPAAELNAGAPAVAPVEEAAVEVGTEATAAASETPASEAPATEAAAE